MNIRVGVGLVTDETAKAFVRLCCETDANNNPKMENGRYSFDAVKYRKITEPYLAGLGIVNDTEKLVNNFEKEIQNELRKEENIVLYSSIFGDPQVKPLLDTNTQKMELRVELLRPCQKKLLMLPRVIWRNKRVE